MSPPDPKRTLVKFDAMLPTLQSVRWVPTTGQWWRLSTADKTSYQTRSLLKIRTLHRAERSRNSAWAKRAVIMPSAGNAILHLSAILFSAFKSAPCLTLLVCGRRYCGSATQEESMRNVTLCALSIPALLWLAPTVPALAQASISIKCGSSTYEVSTGNDQGSCHTVRGPGAGQVRAFCEDNKKNITAKANCEDGCSDTSGSGSCTIKSKKNPSQTVKGSPVKPVSVGGTKPTDPPPKRKSPVTPVSTSGSKQTGDNNQSGTIGKTDTQHSGGGSKH